MAKIVVLATGGTIAGAAASPDDAVRYQAAQWSVAHILQQVPGLPQALQGDVLEDVQLAQIDSKDMDYAVWQVLAQACTQALAQTDVRGVLITHGTDTLEETAYFLDRVLAAAPEAADWRHKPVVLTCAMRPATARLADGPQNLVDALAVVRDESARGVLAVCAGHVHGAQDVRKVQPYRLDAFSSGDAGPLGHVEEGKVRWVRPALFQVRPDAALWQALCHRDAASWPWVEIIASGAGSDGRALRALQHAGVQGLVLAGTGNATLHRALEAEVLQVQAAGVPCWRSSRCLEGQVVAGPDDAPIALAPDALQPAKARIALLLELLVAVRECALTEVPDHD